MPTSATNRFASLTSDALALLSEATGLGYKIQRVAGVDCGLMWAAARCVERGDATSTVFTSLPSEAVEKACRIFWRFDPPRSVYQAELIEMFNPPVDLLRDRSGIPDQALDPSGAVTAAALLVAVFRQFQYRGGAVGLPLLQLRPVRLDRRQAAAALAAPGGFTCADHYAARGRIPAERGALATRAFQLAAYVGSWIVTRRIAEAAAVEVGATDASVTGGTHLSADEVRREWDQLVTRSVRHVERVGCVRLFAFPGPRPWTAAAAPILTGKE